MNWADFPEGPFKPWTGDYFRHRGPYLEQAVIDPELLAVFAPGSDSPLPAGYGCGLDERCVEYPWALANLAGGGRRVLDAGSALNHPWILSRPVFSDKDLHIMTLAPEPYSAWDTGVSYVFGDLRDIPMRDGWYDQVVSISTLEHIGFDNTHYGGQSSGGRDASGDFLQALSELRRVLRPGGRCLVTLPFGAYEDLSIAQQFDSALLARLVEAFAPAEHTAEFFRLTDGGWRRAREEECARCRYVRWAIDFFVDPAGFDLDSAPVEPDHAAAARAVACLTLVK